MDLAFGQYFVSAVARFWPLSLYAHLEQFSLDRDRRLKFNEQSNQNHVL